MSEQFKPLADQVSERMVNLLNDNRSIFTKPMKEDGSSQFVLPINARSKQKYTGPAALVLIMQNRRDPRWLSFDKALYNKTPVKKGAYGTLIEFNSTNELRPKTEDGKPVLNKEGNQKMERVKLDVPVPVQAWLYNGKDLVGLKPLKVKSVPLSPTERAQAILDHSGIKQDKNAVKAYDSPQLYYAVALHHLAHETVKNQLPEIKDKPHEELRTNIASILIGAELNLPYVLEGHQEYLKQWATLLKDDPKELFHAATDAQLIANQVMGYEAKREQQQDAKQEQTQDAKPAQATKLTEGMEIAYNGTTYKVMAEQSRGAVKLEDLTTHDKHRVKPTDGLYKSLVAQLNNPVQHEVREQEMEQGEELEEGLEMAENEEQTKSYSRRR
ncbi:MAG: ArdC-like ssDNA-binding domain-containing protein [Mucilaginibacter sp.]